MNGGKKGNQNPRPLAGRTTYSRINFDDLDPIVRPTRGRIYMRTIAFPRSFGLRPPTRGLRQIGPLRGPFPIGTLMNATQTFLMRNPWEAQSDMA